MPTAIRLGAQRPHRSLGIGGALGAEAMAMKAGVFALPPQPAEGIGGALNAEAFARESGVLSVKKLVEVQPIPELESPVLDLDEEAVRALADNALQDEIELVAV